jgi:site-specific recombinase XerD
VRIHDLRHTYASLLINNGVSLYEVQELLGHSSSAMTQRYAHLQPNQLRSRTEIVSQIVDAGMRF